jgi:integrase
MSIKLSFWIRPSEQTSKNQAPVYLRIQFNGNRTEYSVGISVSPKEWDKEKQQVKGRSEMSDALNGKLKAVRARALTIYNELLLKGEPFFPLTIKEKLTNGFTKAVTFNEAINEYIEKLIALKDSTYSQATINKYLNTQKRVSEYVLKRYSRNQIYLHELNYDFIDGFETFLKREFKHGNNTIAKHYQRISRIVRQSIKKGQLNRYPFDDYTIKVEKAEIHYLTLEEVKKIESKKFDIPRMEIIRKLFLLSCYSGLAFKEMENLRPEHMVTSDGKVYWISMHRQKTKKTYKIALLPQAVALINELSSLKKNIPVGKLLPMISNQKYNSYLKELADHCGIPKRLTSHIGRKTFSIGIALRSSVSIELLSALLGHSNIRVTAEYYSKVTEEIMIEGVKNLAEQLEKFK